MKEIFIIIAFFAACIIAVTAFLVGPQLVKIFVEKAREWAEIIEDARGDE